MDPLSVIAGVIGVLTACVQAGDALKTFYNASALADAKVRGLLTDVESFTRVLQMMKDTLEREPMQVSMQSTGHIGNHWTNLSTCMRDGRNTLDQLREILEKVSKSVSVLDGPRKHLRLRAALDEIYVYQLQIRSYRDTMQLSLQTVILWNQVLARESTDHIVPNLDELHQAIRHMAFDFNDRMAALQGAIETNAEKPPSYNSDNNQLRVLTNLRNCVQSAASVVSSASTTLASEHPDQVSLPHGSDFGDVFPPEPGEAMLRWISSNTVYEFAEQDRDSGFQGSRSSNMKKRTAEEVSGSEHSDSDNELEIEIIQALLKRGKEKLGAKDYAGAEKLFRNCLTRTSNGSLVSLHRAPKSKSEIMTLLLDTYLVQEKWSEAQSLLLDKIAIGSRDTSSESGGVLADMLTLVDVLLHKSSYAEALLYGRRALKGYRKLGSKGTSGVEKSLNTLIHICHLDGNLEDEEEAYSVILSDFLQKQLSNEQGASLSTSTTVRSGELLRQSPSPLHAAKVDQSPPEVMIDAGPSDGNRRLSINEKKKSSLSLREKYVEPQAGIPEPQSQEAQLPLQRRESKKRTPRRLPANRISKQLESSMANLTESSFPKQQETADAVGKDESVDALTPVRKEGAMEWNEKRLAEENSSKQVGSNGENSADAVLIGRRISFNAMREDLADEPSTILGQHDQEVEIHLSSSISESLVRTPRQEVKFDEGLCMLEDPVSVAKASPDTPDMEGKEVLPLEQNVTTKDLPSIMFESPPAQHQAEVVTPAPHHRYLPRSLPPFRAYSDYTDLSSIDGQPMPTEESELPIAQRSTSVPPVVIPESTSQMENPRLYQRVSQRISSMSLQSSASKQQDRMLVKEVVRRKIVIVGDAAIGKSTLLLMSSKGIWPKAYMPTFFDTYICVVEVDGQEVELELSDTAGLAEYDRLRPRSYSDTHVYMICFSIDSPDSLENVEDKWYTEVVHHSYESPFILVGLKKDLRYDSKSIDELQNPDQKQITPEKGHAVAKRILADAYFECSAKTNEGVLEVFEAVTRLALATGKKKKVGGLRRLFGR
ncbi:GTP-binding protein rhoA [Lachnellula arida]|uniref:GTP-binding protein rhoA n=1 Tax=Lachnellula arida TaxID=1316785 RepID=A0A8T9B8U9_9HELO|nr:GTP-binding protein rhoA [Lachnellula arida]